MIRVVLLCIVSISLFVSCNQKESSEFYTINGQIENYEGVLYLSPAMDTIFYLNNFREDTAQVVNGKFKFKFSTKFETPMPFIIRSPKSYSDAFILEPQDQEMHIDSLHFRVKPRILPGNSRILDEELVLNERRKPSIDERSLAMTKINSSTYSNDSIQKLFEIASATYKDQSFSLVKEFAEDYPESYVSFWNLVRCYYFLGYDEKIEIGYENLSSEIKNTETAKIFEERMLMSKLSQNGSPY